MKLNAKETALGIKQNPSFRVSRADPVTECSILDCSLEANLIIDSGDMEDFPFCLGHASYFLHQFNEPGLLKVR